MCDVEKMFHRFHVSKEDRDYLRFLWWENGDTNSVGEAIKLVKEVQAVFTKGKLHLRKFLSNI